MLERKNDRTLVPDKMLYRRADVKLEHLLLLRKINISIRWKSVRNAFRAYK
jgi:hypothetical protein